MPTIFRTRVPPYKRTVAADSGVTDTMVLVECGTPVSELAGELAGATVITIPVMAVASRRPSILWSPISRTRRKIDVQVEIS